jgi:hypothetical protein
MPDMLRPYIVLGMRHGLQDNPAQGVCTRGQCVIA